MPRLSARAGVEHLHDVLCLDGPHGPRLALEASDHRRVGAVLAEDDLHRDAAPGPCMASLVDGTHPAFAELADDLVLVVDDLRLLQAPDDSRTFAHLSLPIARAGCRSMR